MGIIEKLAGRRRASANTRQYRRLVRKLLRHHVDKDKVCYELAPVITVFEPDGLIAGTSVKYVEHELDWYLSKDLSINGHPGIEDNAVWQRCATDDGHINSNYGWCVYSEENGSQLRHAVDELARYGGTRHAVMVYTRPGINTEYCDDVHARYDMLCTMYAMYYFKGHKLCADVHMRSNDIWTGLRNDLAWQQHVYNEVRSQLASRGYMVEKGLIYWIADSLHCYDWEVAKLRKWLKRR